MGEGSGSLDFFEELGVGGDGRNQGGRGGEGGNDGRSSSGGGGGEGDSGRTPDSSVSIDQVIGVDDDFLYLMCVIVAVVMTFWRGTYKR